MKKNHSKKNKNNKRTKWLQKRNKKLKKQGKKLEYKPPLELTDVILSMLDEETDIEELLKEFEDTEFESVKEAIEDLEAELDFNDPAYDRLLEMKEAVNSKIGS